MALWHLAYELVHPVLGAVARNRWLIRRLFGVRIPRDTLVHFDVTTLLLRHALRQVVMPEDRTVLEVGIGQGGLLALGLLSSTRLDVHGIDCSTARVLSSLKVAACNGLAPHFFTSELFSAIAPRHQYDVIFCNPPYVPTREGEQLRLTRRMCADSDRVWDGGADGTQVLRSLLEQAPEFLTPRGRVLFGVQPIFVPPGRIDEIIGDTGWTVQQRIRHGWIPSIAYVVTQASSSAAADRQGAASECSRGPAPRAPSAS